MWNTILSLPLVAKINTDAAIFEEENAIRVGVIIGDEKGDIIAAGAQKIGGDTEVLRVEILVAREGLLAAKELGLTTKILEGRGVLCTVWIDFE